MITMSRADFFKLYQFCEGQIEIRPLPGEHILKYGNVGTTKDKEGFNHFKWLDPFFFYGLLSDIE